MLALVGERLPAPEADEYVQALIQQLRPYPAVRRLPDLRETAVVECAQTYRQHQPSARETVQRHRLPGQLPGTAARRRRQHRPDAYLLGAHGHRRHHHPRVVGLHIADVDAVPIKSAVPTRRFRLARKLGHSAGITPGNDKAVAHARLLSRSYRSSRYTRREYTEPIDAHTTELLLHRVGGYSKLRWHEGREDKDLPTRHWDDVRGVCAGSRRLSPGRMVSAQPTWTSRPRRRLWSMTWPLWAWRGSSGPSRMRDTESFGKSAPKMRTRRSTESCGETSWSRGF